MDELFEALTLIQTGKVKYFPVILFGRDYWSGMADWLRDTVAAGNKILSQDLELFHVTDEPAEAVQWILEASQRRADAPPSEP
jgi:hypothetical protein